MATRKKTTVKKTVKKAAKATQRAVKSGTKTVHSLARRANTVGATLETVGRLVEAGAAAADDLANTIEHPSRAARARAKSAKPRNA
jgi:hypothetical protein